MTRFARAKGSKASNEHVEEEATSWGEMKEQLEQKKQNVQLQKKQKEADAKRKENYNNFLKKVEEEERGKSQWADFPNSPGNILEMKFTNLKRAGKVIEDDNNQENNKALKRIKKTEATHNTTYGKDQTVPKVKPAKKKKVDTNGKGLTTEEVRNKVETKGQKAPLPVKKPTEELTEEEQKKVAKKKEKHQRQAEKRKFKKKLLKEQTSDLNEGENKSNVINTGKVKANSSHLNKFVTSFAGPTLKTRKFDPNKEHKRRKPVEVQETFINGKPVEIVYFDGFPIKREDADRLKELRKQMVSKGLSRSEVKRVMKLERRRAEKAFARDKKNVCYNCRQSGHVLSECPAILANSDNVDTAAIGICFKCGSTEHTSFVCKVVKNQEFRFASCFICKEQGHISWQCPDNARGLYPKGGGCKLCGNVTHLKKDCPQYVAEQEAKSLSLPTMGSENPDEFEFGTKRAVPTGPGVNKIIKFY